MNYASNEYVVSKQVKLRMATGVVSLFSCLLLGSGSALAVWSNDESVTKSHHFITNVSIDDRVHYNIPAQSLSKALVLFGKQAGVEISSDPTALEGLDTTAIKGKFTQSQVLKKLLNNTGLKYSRLDKKTLIVSYPNPVYVQSGDIPLDTITVEGQQNNEKKKGEKAYGPVDGYVAKKTATGTKTDTPIIENPQSVTVVTTEQVKNQKAKSLYEAFSYSAGISPEVINNANEAFVIRGFRVSALTGGIYVDGTKGAVNIFDGKIDPFALERLEVLKGPSSVLYGKAGPGGIINLVTKRPTEDPLHEISVEYGNKNRKQVSLDISDKVDKEGKLSYRLTGLVRDSNTDFDFVNDDRFYIAPALTWKPTDDTTVTLLANYQKNETKYVYGLPPEGTVTSTPNGFIPRSNFISEPGYDRYDNETKSIALILDHRFNQALKFNGRVKYYESKNQFPNSGFFNFNSVTGNADRFAQDRRDYSDLFTADVSLEYKLKTGFIDHTFLVGTDYTKEYHETERYNRTISGINLFNPVYTGVSGPRVPLAFSSIETLRSQGIYFQDQMKIMEKWVLTLGGRQDWTEAQSEAFFFPLVGPKEKNNAFTGRAGLVYLFDNGLAPYFSYSESFQPQLGTTRTGERFDPTTGTQYEAGIRYQPKDGNIFLSAAIYEITQQNVTTTDPVDTNFRIQTGEIRSRGFELEARASIGNNIKMMAAYSYTDARVTKDTAPTIVGKRNANSPYNQFSIWGEYEFNDFNLPGLKIGAGIKYVDDTTALFIDANAPSYTLVDAMVSYDTKNWRYSLNATNLTDEDYVSSCTYACFYGEGRTIIGTATYKW